MANPKNDLDSRAPSISLKARLEGAAFIVVWMAALFLSAGTFRWERGWIAFLTYIIGVSIVGVVAKRSNPTLAQARANWHRSDTERFDKIILWIYYPLTYLQIALAGLDVVRFHWTSMPYWTLYLGVALFALAMFFVGWVMAVNRFAEATVRIQSDRGHTVVTTGPYRFVRHPMYVGAILMYIATPLILGSRWALAFAPVIIAVLVCRTALEDRTLRRELPGYEEFTATTRYRLLPGLW